ncbi:MAG TPA: hypothetical protein P5295_17590 [Spirochaetota bacterium]|nr:hypothetical protein [Spirochaetota bacterium]
MVVEILNALRSNIKNRIRNPFLGTLTLVFIIKNWELFYSLFTLDKKFDLTIRLLTLAPLIKAAFNICSLLYVIVCSLIAFIFLYFMIIISQFFLLFINRKVYPQIEQITDRNSIVTRERFDQIKNENLILHKKNEELHDDIKKMSTMRDELQNKIIELTLKKRKKEEDKNDAEQPHSINIPNSKLFEKFITSLKNDNLYDKFGIIITGIRSNERFLTSDSIIEKLLEYGFIEIDLPNSPRGSNVKAYNFTKTGDDLIQFYLISK